MPTQPPDPPYTIYLDSTFIVDLADPTEYRHQKAKVLLSFLQKRTLRNRIQVMTSVWAVTESQGVLYGHRLTRKGIPKPVWKTKEENVRTLVPPDAAESATADQQIRSVIANLQQIIPFSLYTPGDTDGGKIWTLVQDIAREAAIFPPDSIHLAMALQSACAMIITDDRNFVDKIECCRQSLIDPYRRREFSYIPTLPPFQAHGVWSVDTALPNQPARMPAITALRALGF